MLKKFTGLVKVAEGFLKESLDPGYTEKNDTYVETFLSKIAELREQEFTCDVVIEINDKEIYAHKLVLAAGSPYFSMCLFGKLASKQQVDQSRIQLNDLDFSAVEKIVQYFYSSEIDINEETVRQIFHASDYLQIKWLREKCTAYIKDILSPSNCINFWHFAESLCADQLSTSIVRFIMRNLTEIYTKPEFLELTNERIQRIISCKPNKFYAKSLYLAVIKWTKQDVENRRPIFNELIEKIPFKSLDETFIRAHLANEELILSDHNCLKLFSDAVLCLTPGNKARGSIAETDSLAYIFVLGVAKGESVIQCYNPYDECLKSIQPHDGIFPYAAVAAYKNFICISGGLKDLEPQKNGVLYNTVSDKWIPTEPMNSGKAYHDMVVCKDVLYACNVDFGLERFNIAENTWSEVQVTSDSSLSRNFDESYMSADVLDDRIYAISGFIKDSETKEAVFKSFDLREGKWQPELSKLGMSSIINFNDILYISSTNLPFLEKYDLRNKKLIPCTAPNSCPLRFGHTMTRFESSVHVFDMNTENVKTFKGSLPNLQKSQSNSVLSLRKPAFLDRYFGSFRNDLPDEPNQTQPLTRPLNRMFSYIRTTVPHKFDVC